MTPLSKTLCRQLLKGEVLSFPFSKYEFLLPPLCPYSCKPQWRLKIALLPQERKEGRKEGPLHTDLVHLLTLWLVQHCQHFALKTGRVEIIRPLNSVVCSTSHLHFILPGAIPVPAGGYRIHVVWLESPVQGWHWKLEAKLGKVAAYPLSPHIYPLSVLLFWGCWKPGLSCRAAMVLLQLLTYWNFSFYQTY